MAGTLSQGENLRFMFFSFGAARTNVRALEKS
jgi:hypothetical protein